MPLIGAVERQEMGKQKWGMTCRKAILGAGFELEMPEVRTVSPTHGAAPPSSELNISPKVWNFLCA